MTAADEAEPLEISIKVNGYYYDGQKQHHLGTLNLNLSPFIELDDFPVETQLQQPFYENTKIHFELSIVEPKLYEERERYRRVLQSNIESILFSDSSTSGSLFEKIRECGRIEDYTAEQVNGIVKVQAVFRGYIARKRAEEEELFQIIQSRDGDGYAMDDSEMEQLRSDGTDVRNSMRKSTRFESASRNVVEKNIPVLNTAIIEDVLAAGEVPDRRTRHTLT